MYSIRWDITYQRHVVYDEGDHEDPRFFADRETAEMEAAILNGRSYGWIANDVVRATATPNLALKGGLLATTDGAVTFRPQQARMLLAFLEYVAGIHDEDEAGVTARAAIDDIRAAIDAGKQR